MTRWIELSAEVDGEAVEAVAEAFSRFAHGGVVIEYPTDPGPEIAWNEEPVIARDRPITVRGYLPLGRAGRRRQRLLEEAVWHLGRIWPIAGPTVREVDEADWANAWKDHFQAHRVGERLVIRPTWRQFDPGPDDLVVALDPGMAFGTGLHPSTRLCLLALERLVRPGDRVLDVGTGSGILAIAAARLGASLVRAVDLDGVAIEAAHANVAANDLRDVVQIRHGDAADLPESGAFDVVVANIIARVIVDSAPSLVRQLRPGGHLIASGILLERRAEVTAALAAHGLSLEETLSEADWCALIATPPVPHPAPGRAGEGDGNVPAGRGVPVKRLSRRSTPAEVRHRNDTRAEEREHPARCSDTRVGEQQPSARCSDTRAEERQHPARCNDTRVEEREHPARCNDTGAEEKKPSPSRDEP